MLADFKDWILLITPGLASLAAILAWIAKIRWAKEYEKTVKMRIETVEKIAEERVATADKILAERIAIAESRAVEAKELAEFSEKRYKALIDFGPDKIRKYFEETISLDQQKLQELEFLLKKAKQEIEEKQQEIIILKQEAYKNKEKIENTEKLLIETRRQKEFFERKLREIEERKEENNSILQFLDRPEFDADTVKFMLAQYESTKNWILSSTRRRHEDAKANRHAQAQKVKQKLAEIDAKEEAIAQVKKQNKASMD